MALVPGLVRSGQSSTSSRQRGSTGLEDLAERMAKKKKKEEEDRLAEQQRQEEQRKQEAEQKPQEKPKQKNLLQKIGTGVADIFQADSEADKKRRQERGEAILYKDQQADKKKRAKAFKGETKDEFTRAGTFNFSKDEIEARRAHYESAGLNIDQIISDKAAYDTLLAKYGGDTKKVALARARGKLSDEDKKLEEGAVRYEQELDKAKDTERDYQRTRKAEAGAESVLEQAERGFVRGVAEPIINTPANLQTAFGAALQAVAPAGSRVQKAGDVVYEAGATNRDELAARMVNQGYGGYAADNPLVAGISQGAGSLVASLSAAGALGRTSAAATMFGVGAGADQLQAAKEAGQQDLQSLFIGAVAGTAEGVLEKLGLDKFLGASGSVIKQATTRMLTEGTQEALQSLAQSGVKALYSEVDLQQAIQAALTEGGLGALIGGGASLPMSIAASLQNQGVDPDTALDVGMNVSDVVKGVLAEEGKPGQPSIQTEDDVATEEPGTAASSQPTVQPNVDTTPVSQLGGMRPHAEIQDQIERAHNAGDDARVAELILKLPAEEQPVMRKALNIPEPAAAAVPETAPNVPETGDNVPPAAPVVPDEGGSVPAAGNLLTRDNFGNFLSDAKGMAIAYVDAVDAGDKVRAESILNRVSEIPAAAAPALVGKLQRYKSTKPVQPTAEPRKQKTEADKYPEHLLREYADFIKSLDDQATGGQMIPDGEGGYVRTSEHSQFYRDFYGEHGKKPTKADWLEEAKRQINMGRADKAFIDYANEVMSQPGTAAASGQGIREWQRRKSNPTSTSGDSRRQVLDSLSDAHEGGNRESLRTAEDLMRLADQLNKAGQAGAILRRGDYRSKKNLGVFERKRKKGKTTDEVVKLRNEVIKNPRLYATVLAHELSHAIEYNVNGNTKSTYKLFGDLTKEEQATITAELKEIVNELEGATVAAAKPKYYYKPTEMFARYIETRILHPGRAELIAPTVTEKFEELVAREPLVANLYEAMEQSIDKGFKNFTPTFVKDLRQIYRRRLGKRVGDIAYNAEVVRRAELQRSQSLIQDLLDRKFKDVKDDPAQLFRAAEAVLVTKDGQPQFGTHDFADAFTEQEQKDLEKAGWEQLEEVVKDGKEGFVYTRVRYTPEQAERIFNDLSPEGQQLIKDFTAAKEEAKDEFNRELMKDLYHIDSRLEGWVHHYFEGKPMGGNNKASLRTRVAAAKKQRTGAEGYIEDFRKATTKALLELDRDEINNAFVAKQLARVSKPLAKGDKPEKGWVEVTADGKGGLRLPGEGGVVILQGDGKQSMKLAEKRYQVPEELVKHYREIRDVPGEANMAARALNRIAKYWTLNVLIHPGSTATNFISGGLQYGGKLVNDFYMDLLTANFGMERTRNNLIAPLKVLTPRGWANAPDWLYGGYRSTLVGQYATGEMDTRIDRGLDAYGNKMLKLFSLVETYWKKTIALSEGSKLAGASKRRITARLQKDEQEIITQLNEAIDTYAFDYDNKPLWLNQFDRKGGKILKPFMTYPYKLAKFYTGFVASGFDKTLPWQQRTAKILTIATIVAFIAALYKDREDEATTPEGTEKTPLSLKPGGRVFMGTDASGKEIFLRVAKYPFFNLTSLGKAAIDRNGTEAMDLLREQIGTVGPGIELFNLATGRADQFSQYTPASVRVADIVGSFIPAFRILTDTGAIIDEKSRAPKTFVQGIGSQLPIWGSEEQRTELRGNVRTMKIPDETEEGRSISKTARTVTEREVTREREDVLLSLLTGIYVRRIDPKEARAQELREIRDEAETEIRRLLTEGQEADAETIAKEHGLEIPPAVYRYYRNLD